MNERKLLKKSHGITLIALVISIIVMLILAGVSLNATIGDNGIISKAQEASMISGMTALEEWLQEKYIEYYGKVDSDTNKPEYLNHKINGLLLKEGVRNYIINSGKIYYLINKNALPTEIQKVLKGGDSTDYSAYSRLIDVYGVTKDLEVYYLDSSNNVQFGKLENYDIDPNTLSYSAISNSDIANQLVNSLKNDKGIETTAGKLTLGQISTLDKFTLDGKNERLSDLTAIVDCFNLEKLILKDVKLTSLNGIEKLSKLNYIYFKNVICDDYSKLASVWGLQYLYLCMPPDTMNEEICNDQVLKLGEGLENATKLENLQYFGISRKSCNIRS